MVAAFFAGYASRLEGVPGREGVPSGVTVTGRDGEEVPAAFVAVAVTA
jgi:hypothetical protein